MVLLFLLSACLQHGHAYFYASANVHHLHDIFLGEKKSFHALVVKTEGALLGSPSTAKQLRGNHLTQCE